MSTQQIDVTGLKQRIDLRAVARNYTRLDKQIEGNRELHGPCPFCGGRDRFYVSPGVAGCRVCGFGGDVIAFIQKAEGLDFMGAVEFLDKGAITERAPVQPSGTEPPTSTDEDKRRQFQAQAPALMDAAHRRLMAEDTPGGEYLQRRLLDLDTWRAYRLGYVDDAEHCGPAVAMPWYRGGNLTGIRFRLLNPPEGMGKIVSMKNSLTSRLLYGGQAMTTWTKHDSGLDLAADRTLFLVEGEINAMSVAQVTRGARVDVLSFGPEGTVLSPAAIAYAQRFRAVVVWMDEEWFARDRAQKVGGMAYWNTRGGTLKPDGKHTEGGTKTDANDHLLAGRLPDLVEYLWRESTAKQHAEALKWDIDDWRAGR